MRVISIETTSDTYECETCGMDWAEGGKIYIDDELVDEIESVAHCFGGTHASEDDLILIALAHMGITVEVDGDRAHITCVEVSERRDEILSEVSNDK